MTFSPAFPDVGDALLTRMALLAIGIYQRHLSPRKGYGCAHRVLHGGTGCSGFAARAIRQNGWKNGSILMGERFKACHAAGQILRAQSDSNAKKRRRAPNSSSQNCWCDPCDGFTLILCCDAATPGALPCDCNPCT